MRVDYLESVRRFPEWCRLVIEQQPAEAAVESIGRYLDDLRDAQPSAEDGGQPSKEKGSSV